MLVFTGRVRTVMALARTWINMWTASLLIRSHPTQPQLHINSVQWLVLVKVITVAELWRHGRPVSSVRNSGHVRVIVFKQDGHRMLRSSTCDHRMLRSSTCGQRMDVAVQRGSPVRKPTQPKAAMSCGRYKPGQACFHAVKYLRHYISVKSVCLITTMPKPQC